MPPLYPFLTYPVPQPLAPTSISGLKLWYDASQLAGYTDGQAINPLTDFSGNTWDASDATSSHQPLYKTGILNGKPISRWDGSLNQLTVNSGAFAITNNVASCTVVSVAAAATIATSVRKILQINTNASGAAAARLGVAANNGTGGRFTPNGRRLDANSNQVVTGVGNILVANSFYIFVVTVSWVNATLTTYINGGSPDAYTQAFSTAGNTSATNSNTIQVGSAGGSNLWSGDIAEIAAFVPAISTDSLNQLGMYLQQKWGVPWALVG